MKISDDQMEEQQVLPTEPPRGPVQNVMEPSGLLTGWRLRSVTSRLVDHPLVQATYWPRLTSIALAMFLVKIEVSVVATSLVAIVDDLQGFNRIGWVVTSYLVTYTSTCQHQFQTLYC